jgi:hypothetical protein
VSVFAGYRADAITTITATSSASVLFLLSANSLSVCELSVDYNVKSGLSSPP